RHKWTGVVTGRVMDAHIVVQQPSGKCRLFLYGLHQPKEHRVWGEAVLNGVGDSHRVLCERFGAAEGQPANVNAMRCGVGGARSVGAPTGSVSRAGTEP